MEILNEEQLKMVAGGNGGGNYESFNNPRNYTGHTSYGGQGGGFVGTNSNGLDLGSIIRDNPLKLALLLGSFLVRPQCLMQ